MNAIPTSPEYDLLKIDISEARTPLVFVVGAGLSRPAGLPDWKGLRAKLSEALRKKQQHDGTLNAKANAREFQSAFNQKDYWVFFEKARRILGRTTFTRLIEEALTPKDDRLPRSYSSITSLKPRGIVSLNLDKFAGDAVASLRQNQAIIPILGIELEQKWRLLNDESNFVVYLHGHIQDSKSWVLTHKDFARIKDREGRTLFLKHLYNDFTVIFCGLSADDVAVSRPFLELTQSGFTPPRVYWLTSRLDENTARWAKKIGIQLVTYLARTDDEHTHSLDKIFDDIRKHRSLDTVSDPLPKDSKHSTSLTVIEDDPHKLAQLDPEEVRKNLLEIFESKILGASGKDFYKYYYELCNKYDYAIKTKSFYISNELKFKTFFDCEVIFPALGQGNFGTVYQVRRESRDLAVKIIHPHIIMNEEMLGGFRRGVESMRIITKYNIANVARIIDSYEIPPSILMEFVSGNSIQEIVDNSDVSKIFVRTKIEIMAEVASIVDNCHRLVENVLHRDIKPSNIMIKDFDYTTNEFGGVVVLDFDMSWHKGSHEKDVIFESRDDLGYLAPEQTNKKSTYTSRSTKVDCYGLGMTLYSFLTGLSPVPNAALSDGWFHQIKVAVGKVDVTLWVSVRNRIARLIRDCTRFDQAERIEFVSVKRRLEALKDFFGGRSESLQVDLVAEELLALVGGASDYDWDDVEDFGELRRVDGVKVVCRGSPHEQSVRVALYYESKGGLEFQNVTSNIVRANDVVVKLMRELGTSVENHTTGPGQFMVTIVFSQEALLSVDARYLPKSLADKIRTVIEQLVR